MASIFRQAIRLLFVLLGWFEVFMVYRMITEDSQALHVDLSYYPLQFFQTPFRYLLIMWTFYLGLIRLIWGMGDNSFPAWLSIIFGHLAECVFLWSLASLGHFNKHYLPLLGLIQDVAAVKVGTRVTSAVLFIVPGLVLLLVLHGPGDSRGGSSSKSKKN